MSIFNLPDLGEGLPDAEINEWYVKEGDTVKVDQPLASMETAKAVVDVPSPQAGIIQKLYGQPGDVIKTGTPLVAFESDEKKPADKGTVVGNLEESSEITDDHFTIGTHQRKRPKTTATVRMLAKKLGVDLDNIPGTGEHGVIVKADVEKAAQASQVLPEGFEPLKGVRRAMHQAMVQSHQEVVPVSLFDEADIHAWDDTQDITLRLIRAIVSATQKEPALNAWFNTQHAARKTFSEVHLGIAMDSDEGLFVPVITDVATKKDEDLRQDINDLKLQVKQREIDPKRLSGATITLSNFGKFAGRYASPIIVPPMVAILAAGRVYHAPVATEQGIESHRIMPLSLSFDHRAVTGGEATRFLGEVMRCLSKKQ